MSMALNNYFMAHILWKRLMDVLNEIRWRKNEKKTSVILNKRDHETNINGVYVDINRQK